MEIERFASLIETIYDGVLNPESWRTLAPSIAGLFAAESTTLQIHDFARGTAALIGQTANYNLQAHVEYETYFHKIDPWVDGAKDAGSGCPVLSQELISDSDFAASEICNDYRGISASSAFTVPMARRSSPAAISVFSACSCRICRAPCK